MNFINLNCPPLPYFIVGGGCVYRPGDIHERRTIRNVFDLIYVHSGTLYLEQDPFRVELNAGQFFIITPDTPHRGSRVCQEKTTTSWVHFYTNGKYSLSDEFYPDNVTRRAAPKFYYSPQNFRMISSSFFRFSMHRTATAARRKVSPGRCATIWTPTTRRRSP